MELPVYSSSEYPRSYNAFLQTCADRLITWQLQLVWQKVEYYNLHKADEFFEWEELYQFLIEYRKTVRRAGRRKSHHKKIEIYNLFWIKRDGRKSGLNKLGCEEKAKYPKPFDLDSESS
uniref:V2 n=1 Tax=Tomato apical leaf curl virus TaxID=2060142 RepID=A0A7G7NB24_9GEMI|nr:V2 [Tomato apical leaf curl virus]